MSVYINSLESIKLKLKLTTGDPNGAEAFLTNTCYKHMDKYVPMDNGDLRTNVFLTPNTITYASPYASYQYYGERADGSHKVKHYTTPGTGPYWDERMKSAEINDVVKEVQKFVGGK